MVFWISGIFIQAPARAVGRPPLRIWPIPAAQVDVAEQDAVETGSAETVKQARQRPQTGKFQTTVAPRCPDRGCVADASISRNAGQCLAKPRRPYLPMEPPPRRYLCACCHTAVILCSHCDRGQRYCGDDCAGKVRSRCVQAAGQRYQTSLRDRHAHAQRQRRYRSKQTNKVTHQGSPPAGVPALLPLETNASVQATPIESEQCHFCHCACGSFVRIGFLRCRIRRPSRLPQQERPQHAHDP